MRGLRRRYAVRRRSAELELPLPRPRGIREQAVVQRGHFRRVFRVQNVCPRVENDGKMHKTAPFSQDGVFSSG